MKLEQQKALEILYNDEGGEVVLDEIAGHFRWSVRHKLIVKIGSKFYQTFYSVGATEYQDEQPWQSNDLVNFVEVEPKEVIVTQYVEKK